MNRHIRRTFFVSVLLSAVTAAAGQDPAITEPKFRDLPIPEYSQAARAAGISGDVFIVLFVDKKGKAKVVDSYGPSAPCSNLDDPITAAVRAAAESAASRSLFDPATFKGKPMDRGVVIRYHFDVREPAAVIGQGAPSVGEDLFRAGLAINVPEAKYPAGAWGLTSISGSVRVVVRVDEKGLVSHAGILSGHKVFRRSALDAACQSTFHPSLVGGRAVPTVGVIRFQYNVVHEQ